jgi:hypothetical protein
VEILKEELADVAVLGAGHGIEEQLDRENQGMVWSALAEASVG